MRNRKIVADFAKETGKDITLIDAQIWPMGVNDKKILLKASALVFGRKKARYYLPFFTNNPNISASARPDFNTVIFRPKDNQDLLDMNRGLSRSSTEKLHLNLSDYFLHHELFHHFDYVVNALNDEELTIEHRQEFFCDFAACLKILADNGENLFMDVARMRSLNSQASEPFYKESSSELELGQYLNHHLYVTYQEWRKENPDIDISQLTVPEIVEISAECTLKRAHKTERLRSYVKGLEKTYPNDKDVDKRITLLIERLDRINKNPVKSPKI